MTNITKHNSEKEREYCNSKQCRVDFFISWYTISIDNFLKRCCKVISLKVSWRFFFSSWLSHSNNMRKCKLKQSSFFFRYPYFGNHGTSRFIFILNNLKHIECIIDNKFLLNKNSISLILRTLIFSNRNNTL